MAMTPNSSTVPYITVDEFIDRKDLRDVSELVRDDNTVATPSELQSDTRLAAALASASGEVESACLRGGMYSAGDLAALTGVSAEYLKKIVSDVAIYNLYGRRGGPQPSDYVTLQYQKAMEALKALSEGVAIFAFAEVEAAGSPANEFMTASDYQNANYFSFNNHREWGYRNTVRRGL